MSVAEDGGDAEGVHPLECLVLRERLPVEAESVSVHRTQVSIFVEGSTTRPSSVKSTDRMLQSMLVPRILMT